MALSGRGIRKTFVRDNREVVLALDDVTLQVHRGTLAALVGPDGAGKTTLIRLAAGLLPLDRGELEVLGLSVSAEAQKIQERIGYMPQKFGLYEDLSVQENLDLYADLHGMSRNDRQAAYPRLMDMTALGPFTERLAGQLSGGMKQKLGLACTLVSRPELLLLDEPTVGVDPLSRRELWEIIFRLVHEQGLSVLLSTSYLDEAERCGHVVVMHRGKVLAQGSPGQISQLAEGRAFIANPPAGTKAREFQARLLDAPTVIDAVPVGGQVRLVRATDESSSTNNEGSDETGAVLWDAAVSAAAPRFEDGFMILLHRTGAAR
ncbi:MAG TPA: ABC transporter ATP-binding protein, partial [Candidatus Binatia bacterium]